MRHLHVLLLVTVVCLPTATVGLAADSVIHCKLDLVRRPPLPDDWEKAKKLIVYDCVDSQSFRRATEKGVTFLNSEGDFAKVVKKEPAKYVADRPLRGVATLGSNRYVFALDHKSKDSRGYDRLYFDRNGNGDLTDDEPIDLLPSKDFKDSKASVSDNRGFPPIVVSSSVDGTKLDYPLNLRRYCVHKPDYEYVVLYLAVDAYRRGEVTLDGKKHTIAVLDWNCNGRFDDVVSVPAKPQGTNDRLYANRGDILLIDPEKIDVENLSWSRPLGEHRQFLGKLTGFEGKYYATKVSPSGDEITWTPCSPPLGRITSSHAPCHVELVSELGYLDLNIEKSKPATIPAGRWRLLSYGYSIKDWKETASPAPTAGKSAGAEDPKRPARSKSNVSRILAQGTFAGSPLIVEPGQTTALKFGPPYRASVRVDQWNGEISLNLELHGTGGEEVSGLAINGGMPERPTFTITDPQGKVVEQGQLEYG
jgi:hypothetical protein